MSSEDRLNILLTVSRPLMEDAVYNYATARFIRDRLHEDLDIVFNGKLEEMLEKDRLGEPDARY